MTDPSLNDLTIPSRVASQYRDHSLCADHRNADRASIWAHCCGSLHRDYVFVHLMYACILAAAAVAIL